MALPLAFFLHANLRGHPAAFVVNRYREISGREALDRAMVIPFRNLPALPGVYCGSTNLFLL